MKIDCAVKYTLSQNVKKAFTLVEILLAIGILGVVAVVTIPPLVKNYQKSQYVTALEKAYTAFNQVLKQMAADAGCVNDLRCSGLFATGTTNQVFGDEFIKYIKVIKNCGISTGQGCWSVSTNANYDGTSITDYYFDNSSEYKFITADGMSVQIANYSNNCTQGGINSSTGALGYMSQVCGFIIFDVNGHKEPNDRGRDVFHFFITNGNGAFLYPSGGKDDNFTGSNQWWNDAGRNGCSNSEKMGYYCPGRIIENNWQMDY